MTGATQEGSSEMKKAAWKLGTGWAARLQARLLVVVATLMLSACGGGGGGRAPDAQPVLPVPALGLECLSGSVARLAYPSEVRVGQANEVGLLACGAELADPRWRQLSGATLTLSQARSQALSLELPSPGTYRLAVAFSDAQGRSHGGEFELRAVAPGAAGLSVRGEPSVWAGGQLSLRAWPQNLSADALLNSRLQWSHVAGPVPQLNASDAELLVFTAPAVNGDAVLRLRATLSLADGRAFSDDFDLLVQPAPVGIGTPLFSGSNPASRVYVYQPDSPLATALTDCIYSPKLSSSPNNLCTLAHLPLLGQAHPGQAPSVEQVMQRVLVSNDWMGQVFERFLREQDPNNDFRRMLAATTAVVIGSRVRPAFYWSATGAIYLDASYLWLSPEQRDTLSEAPDPRSAYGKSLSYSSPWRYVLNNAYATKVYPVKDRASRELAELRFELGRLLYHELAHAADFLPPRVHASLNSGLRVYEAVPAQTTSLSLLQRLAFYAQQMVGLGKVLFFGATATATQIAYTPDDIANFFSHDRVTDDYSYSLPDGQSVPREDAAMLVEEAMMQLRYGVMRDVAITPRLQDGASSADLLLTWGQRGRVGETAIRPRVALVLADLLPWMDVGASDRLAPPLLLRPGLSWGVNLDQGALAANQPRALSAAERLAEDSLRRQQIGRQEQLRQIQQWRLPNGAGSR